MHAAHAAAGPLRSRRTRTRTRWRARCRPRWCLRQHRVSCTLLKPRHSSRKPTRERSRRATRKARTSDTAGVSQGRPGQWLACARGACSLVLPANPRIAWLLGNLHCAVVVVCLAGYSRALDRTGFWIPELCVMLDAGPVFACTAGIVLLVSLSAAHVGRSSTSARLSGVGAPTLTAD